MSSNFVVFVRNGNWYSIYQRYSISERLHMFSNEIADLMEMFSVEEVVSHFDQIQWYDGSEILTQDGIQLMKSHPDPVISSLQSQAEWYKFLRQNQDSLKKMMDCGCGLAGKGHGEFIGWKVPYCIVDFDKKLVGDQPFGTRIPL
jgi:hypothetical protein